jgi:phosphotransferase system enzyme I (PtsI)
VNAPAEGIEGERFRGLGVSPGIAIAPALVLHGPRFPVPRIALAAIEVEAEAARFERALRSAARQLRRLRERVRREAGDPYARVFEAQILILKDPALLEETVSLIRRDEVNAAWALQTVVRRYGQMLAQVAASTAQERAASDIEDVELRIQTILSGGRRGYDLASLTRDVVLVSRTLSPSDAARLNHTRVVGLAIDGAGPTSHTAIIAGALGIPAVVGLQDLSDRVHNGDLMVLDGADGTVVRSPSDQDLAGWRARRERQARLDARRDRLRELPAITRDGAQIRLLANVELAEELETARRNGAEGVGLYRSEFLYLREAPALPDEELHFRTYRSLAEQAEPHEVIIRTLDLGGDEYCGRVLDRPEPNPVLGLRGIRLSLKRTDLFRTQVRGILRAARHGRLRMMFPMVSGLEELARARAIIAEVHADLMREGVPHAAEVPVGIMIEIPAAALLAEHLAGEVDFFSIGTNDLIQYTLAIDRGNASVSYLYQPLHPAILGMIRGVVVAASRRGLRLSVCGEMASDPVAVLILLGLGVAELSMSPASIPGIKQVIRDASIGDCRTIADAALRCATVEEVETLVRQRIRPLLPTEDGGPPP